MFFDAKSVFAVVSVACFVWPSGAIRAQEAQTGDTLQISLSEARSLAARLNPELLAALWRPEAASGNLRAARTLRFNPDVSFESRTPGNGIASRYEAAIGLELEVAGQRGLRSLASEAALSSAYGRFDDEARLVLAEVSRAHSHLVATEQRLALVNEIDRLNAQLRTAVGVQLAEGEVSVLEANLVAIEATRARARTIELSGARQAAALTLGRLLGRDSNAPIRTAGPAAESTTPLEATPTLDAYVLTALALRPDVRALEFDLERARQESRLEQRSVMPNLRIAGLVVREDPLADPSLGLSIGFSLPLLNRNQGQRERRQAEVAESEQLRRSAELRVRTEVENALRAFQAAEREVLLLEAELLGPIRQNQALLDIAYREGKLDLASLLLLRNQLLDAEMGYWDAWERRAGARSDLETATGTILQDVTLGNGNDR